MRLDVSCVQALPDNINIPYQVSTVIALITVRTDRWEPGFLDFFMIVCLQTANTLSIMSDDVTK